MSSSRVFVQRVEQELLELDALLDRIEADLGRIRRAEPLPSLAPELAEAEQRAGALAAELRSVAEAHGIPGTWADRAELGAVVAELARRMAARETEIPRARLRDLGAVLARGTLTHRTGR